MTEKKSNEPELIEDSDLDDSSGGAAPNVLKIQPTGYKLQTDLRTTPDGTAAKIEIGALKAGDGSV